MFRYSHCVAVAGARAATSPRTAKKTALILISLIITDSLTIFKKICARESSSCISQAFTHTGVEGDL